MDIPEDRDLTGQDGDLGSPEFFERLVTPELQTEPYNHLKQQERVRGRIAEGLTILLAAIILLAFITLWCSGGSFDDLAKLMTIVFGPVVALVGTAIGYYFGGKTGGGASNN